MHESSDRFVWGVHRDKGGHREAVPIRTVLLRHVFVIEPAQGHPLLDFGDLEQRNPDRRVEHGKVDTGLDEFARDSA